MTGVANNYSIMTRSLGAFPGDLTRPTAPFTIEPAAVLSTTTTLSFGAPVALDTSGKIRAIVTGDSTAASVYGFLVRVFPTQSSVGPNAPFGTNTGVDINNTVNILRDGYIAVNVVAPVAPVKGGAVYIQYVADTVSGTLIPIGAITTASDASKNFVLPGAEFTGGIDANGNSEIRVRIA